MPWFDPSRPTLLPGLGLTVAIAILAYALQQVEVRLLRYALIEAIVIAMLLGIVWRNLMGVHPRLEPGITFTAKPVLELAIVLLGASVNLPQLMAAGTNLLLAIVLVVSIGIGTSLLIGRSLGLNLNLALLVAVGNAICGNSAIAALAPVIGASKEDVASSIALTAVLGVVVVLGLPLLIPVIELSSYQYGVLAGMTVYAVPQVLATTFPVSALSTEVGTLVKLVRVLLLGPIVLVCSLLVRAQRATTKRIGLGRLVPWFITGFLLMSTIRSLGLLPGDLAESLRALSRWLTIAAMAALGLGVDIRSLRRVGLPVGITVLASLTVLIVVSLMLILGLNIGAPAVNS